MICIKMYCYITVQKADCWEIPFCQTAAKFVILEVVFRNIQQGKTRNAQKYTII